MKKGTKVVIIVVVLAVMIFIINQVLNSGPGEYDDFAQCLTDNGVIMYGTDWCHFCKDQKSRFGKSFKLVNYVDCDRYKGECLSAGVEGYPTWVIDDEVKTGVQPLAELAAWTGCELNSVE